MGCLKRRAFALGALLMALSIHQSGAQQLVFSPQGVIGKKSRALELWGVTGSVPAATRPPLAATIYALAAKHGIVYVDPSVATARMTARDEKSVAALLFRWGTYFETGTTELVNLKVIATNTQISIGLNIAMAIVNALLPSVQRAIPVPDPNIAAKIISTSLLMDAQGAVSGLFWAEPSENQSFVETLPQP
ncbi:MAG: hypothetical protein JO099_01665 [Acidobacteriia bacterium]|nr:hypothetical protein [Terriglobia bacterium]